MSFVSKLNSNKEISIHLIEGTNEFGEPIFIYLILKDSDEAKLKNSLDNNNFDLESIGAKIIHKGKGSPTEDIHDHILALASGNL